ncbi:MAG TPA: CGNR zinc finger domain-containing protein [Streptosporangiaceae bacterium]
MGLTSYAELAVRLVNSASSGGRQDMLSDPEAFRALLADRSDLRGPVTRVDLDALRHLRDELTAVFSACTQGDPATGVERLNALLISHPVHPVIVPAQGPSRRDRRPYQLSLSGSGSVSDRFTTGAVMGLATVLTQFGPDRLGRCGLACCTGVFVDTSPNGSRRYCTEQCANRANVTAFRFRRRTGAGGSAGTAAG